MLEAWRCTFSDPVECVGQLFTKNNPIPETLLSTVFFAAISIYLSGIFDYEITYWQSRDIPVPCIPEDKVQEHLNSILTLTEVSLQLTTLSPLLFLFPLRIAGARSYEWWQRDRVLLLLGQIAQNFAVAQIFKMELGQLWHERDSQVA